MPGTPLSNLKATDEQNPLDDVDEERRPLIKR